MTLLRHDRVVFTFNIWLHLFQVVGKLNSGSMSIDFDLVLVTWYKFDCRVRYALLSHYYDNKYRQKKITSISLTVWKADRCDYYIFYCELLVKRSFVRGWLCLIYQVSHFPMQEFRKQYVNLSVKSSVVKLSLGRNTLDCFIANKDR